MDSKIRVFLLRDKPVIFIDGKPIKPLGIHASRLLFYILETNEAEYSREALVRLFYGTLTDDNREAFRKQALFSLKRRMPDLLLEASDDFIRFKPDSVWLDSRVFIRQANDLLQRNAFLSKDDYPATKETLDLYKEPFLLGYPPDYEIDQQTEAFLTWLEKHRRDLETTYHRLLDLVIPFLLEQERSWEEAERYALRWLGGSIINASARPLQYLLWLAHRQNPQQDEQIEIYLTALRDREENGESPMGPSWTAWNSLLKRGATFSLSRLFSHVAPDAEESVKFTPEGGFDRSEKVEQIVTTILAMRDQQIFALKGYPGAGKTEIVHAVAHLLRQRHSVYKLVRVELTPQLDLELLCNRILSEIGRQDLFGLDYPQKRQRLKQLLQAPNLIVIIDEGHTTHFAQPETRDPVLAIVGGARVMLVARELSRFDHYVIDIEGLDEGQSRAFLVKRVPWLREVDATMLTQVTNLTQGLPLLLYIIIGGLKKELVRLTSLLQHLTSQSPSLDRDPIYDVYEGTLNWLWQYLESRDKDLLYALNLFAPGEGADVGELAIVLSSVLNQEGVEQRLKRLVEMHMIIRKSDTTEEPSYLLHPIIYDFVGRRTRHPRRPYAQMIEQAYVSYILDFVLAHADQFDRLDEHQQNLFRMFELVILGNDQKGARASAVEALNKIYPYFERRGMYSKAAELFARVREEFEFESADTSLQILFYAGKIANIQAKYDLAIELFEQALSLEDASSLNQRRGGLYHAIGNIYSHKGQYDDAMKNLKIAEGVAKANQQTPLLYSVWSNMGLTMFRQSQFEFAHTYYQRVSDHLGEDLFKLPGNLQPIAQHVENALGLTFLEMGAPQEAEIHFQKSLALARVINYPELIGQLYLNLGVNNYYIKNYEAAGQFFAQGALIAEQSELITLQIEIMWNQGVLAAAQDSYRQAIYLLKSALIAAEEHVLEWIKGRILVGLGEVHLGYGLYPTAQQCFVEAILQPAISAKHFFQALYGLSLSVAVNERIIGDNDLDMTLKMISPILSSCVDSSSKFFSEASKIELFLNQAHDVFSRDLDHLPGLARYRIVDALKIWISNLASKQK